MKISFFFHTFELIIYCLMYLWSIYRWQYLNFKSQVKVLPSLIVDSSVTLLYKGSRSTYIIKNPAVYYYQSVCSKTWFILSTSHNNIAVTVQVTNKIIAKINLTAYSTHTMNYIPYYYNIYWYVIILINFFPIFLQVMVFSAWDAVYSYWINTYELWLMIIILKHYYIGY